jgi:hypothetical protein
MSEPREKIRLPDRRFVRTITPIAHNLNWLLRSYEIAATCAYRGDSSSLLRMALFENPTFLVNRFCTIYKCIRLHDPEQTQDILKFFLWLLEHFLPFLAHCERFIANVRIQVDIQLIEHIPPLEEIISTLRDHFSVVPLQILRCMIVTVMRPIPRVHYQSGISGNQYLTAVAIAYLRGNGPEVSLKMMSRFGLTFKQLTEIHMYLSHFPRIRGKSFWRKVHVITIAVNFLIRKFPKSWWSHIIMRVLSGL